MNNSNWFLITFLFLTIFNSFSQKNKTFKKFNQKDFDNYKINHNTYNFWWYENNYNWFPKEDTIPYLVDDREYQGLINYGIKYTSKDRSNLIFLEDYAIYNLKVNIESCTLSVQDNIVEISGSIKGGWPNGVLPRLKKNVADIEPINYVDIFIGKTTDTVSLHYFENIIHTDNNNIKYRGKDITSRPVLDTFPSKYIHSYKNVRTVSGAIRKFNIRSKVDENSILIFGAINCYSEIYDIGNLLFTNESERQNKPNNYLSYIANPKVILRNNILEADKDKIRNEKPKYYTISENAEKYILIRQYAKAKDQYKILLEKNPYIFARDMHNAVRCSVLSRDYETAIKWCERLALKGVSLSYFDKKTFVRLKKEPIWKEFLTKYDSLNQKFKNGINQKLITAIGELIKEDQKYYAKTSRDTIKWLDLAEKTESIDTKFINLIQKEGFPTEEKIGIRISKDQVIYSDPIYSVLRIHSLQTQSSKFNEIEQILGNNNNRLDYDRNNLDIFKTNGNTCLKIYKGKLYNNKNCGANQNAIQKVKFLFNNEHQFILDVNNYTIIPYEKSTEKIQEEELSKNFQFITQLTDDWFFYEK